MSGGPQSGRAGRPPHPPSLRGRQDGRGRGRRRRCVDVGPARFPRRHTHRRPRRHRHRPGRHRYVRGRSAEARHSRAEETGRAAGGAAAGRHRGRCHANRRGTGRPRLVHPSGQSDDGQGQVDSPFRGMGVSEGGRRGQRPRRFWKSAAERRKASSSTPSRRGRCTKPPPRRWLCRRVSSRRRGDDSTRERPAIRCPICCFPP